MRAHYAKASPLQTEDERFQIFCAVTEKLSHLKVAAQINKHHSTVPREVLCNKELSNSGRYL